MKPEFLEMVFSNWNVALPHGLKEAARFSLVTPTLIQDPEANGGNKVIVEVKTSKLINIFTLNKDGKVTGMISKVR